MTDQQKPDLKSIEPISTWTDEDQPPAGSSGPSRTLGEGQRRPERKEHC